MKTKSKLFTVALISCALVLAFTACAGCLSTSMVDLSQTNITNNPGTADNKTSAISPETPIKDGETVAVYFTLNLGDNTTFSYDPEEYTSENLSKYIPYRIVADSNSNILDNDYSSIILTAAGLSIPVGIYADELNAIAKAVVGNHYGDRVSVPVSSNFNAIASCTAEDLKDLGYDIHEVKVGDVIPMSLAYSDVSGRDNIYFRYGVVSSINEDLSGIMLNCGSDSIDIVILEK